jgi:hypothetical protein
MQKYKHAGRDIFYSNSNFFSFIANAEVLRRRMVPLCRLEGVEKGNAGGRKTLKLGCLK